MSKLCRAMAHLFQRHRWAGLVLVTLTLSYSVPSLAQEPATAPAIAQTILAPTTHDSSALVPDVSPLWSLPFVTLLGCIALMPLLAGHWWERNYPHVAIGLGLVTGVYYLLLLDHPHARAAWLGEMREYISFIALLTGLYIVSGGIVIHVSRKATPLANCTLLLIGAVIANLLGTTGAAMLLIRPYLRMNKGHLKPFHVIFFIFIVANIGGSLTPIGDPPLFLGYLKGVPFWWVPEHLWPMWALAVGLLLAIFFVLDTRDHGNQERHHPGDTGPAVSLLGVHNFLFILLILAAVFRESFFDVLALIRTEGLGGGHLASLIFSRELLMIGAAVGSKLVTAATIYHRNEFKYGPIREVAILFVGIFSTMVPALNWLENNAQKMPLKTPGQFYFASGSLSSVLDNAPTYLTFLETRVGELPHDQVAQAAELLRAMKTSDKLADLHVDPRLQPTQVRQAMQAAVFYHPEKVRAGRLEPDEVAVHFLVGVPALNIFLVAISIGAVFWGACTYIGNGPNFMVKAIAEHSGVKMPSFTAYITLYTCPILIPVLAVVWAVFFR